MWEIPGHLYFTQYNERTGKQARVHRDVLEEMERAGWIRRVSQSPSAHKLDFWEIGQEGREVMARFPSPNKKPGPRYAATGARP